MFDMDHDDCVEVLAKHAKIKPIITLTVWKELVKENKDFFRAYFIHKSEIYSGTTTRSINEARTKIEALNIGGHTSNSDATFQTIVLIFITWGTDWDREDDEFNVRQACKSTLQQILPLLDVEHIALLVNRRAFNSDHRALDYVQSINLDYILARHKSTMANHIAGGSYQCLWHRSSRCRHA
eukprot:Gb_07221 [translate_table: standard]